MTVNFDFSKIRSYNSSQTNGFEEFICQLAHLEYPSDTGQFIRKEGAGGDAGVECFWKLKDKSEHAWQAKYFLGKLGSSQWKQINKSVETALKKHPEIKKYYVCIPKDRTDSRKSDRDGKNAKSELEKWSECVVNWTKLASSKGMEVEFIFWGKHEIVQRLISDKQLYSGLALYWFDEAVLSFPLLNRCLEKSRRILGDRFTPEFHVDLPIAKVFDGLTSSPEWWNHLEERYSIWRTAKERFNMGHGGSLIGLDLSQFPWSNAHQIASQFDAQLKESIHSQTFLNKIPHLKELSSKLKGYLEQCQRALNVYKYENLSEDPQKHYQALERNLINLEKEIYKLEAVFESDSTAAGRLRALLITGEAGIGKSHLLCDVATKRLELNMPTLLFLGQHYTGENPLCDIKDFLDMNNYSRSQVLGAINAAGEYSSAKFLLIIDAVNEGPNRELWHSRMAELITEVKDFPYIVIAFSCRSTYVDYIIPESLGSDQLIRIEHFGFKGYEHRAAELYLSLQGISKPSTPISAPEFSNPLFLKTCCTAIKNRGEKSFPKGHRGVAELFDFYLDSLERNLMRKMRVSHHDQVARNGLMAIAEALYPGNLSGIPWKEARQRVDHLPPNSCQGKSLLDMLIDEGALSEDIVYGNLGGKRKGSPVVRFTYERFSDHFIAKTILEKYHDLSEIKNVFLTGNGLGDIFLNERYYSMGGIIEALALAIAEKYHCELFDLIPEENKNDWLFEKSFINTLKWRSNEAFFDRTLALLNSIQTHLHNNPIWDTLLALATEPEHPWNAEFLHRNLHRRKLPERDEVWSTYLAVNDHEEDEDYSESIVRTLINWAQFANLDEVEKERIRLCAITLIWFTTTSNRKVRDQATKALVRLLSSSISLLPSLLNKFKDVDDLYLQERLMAVVYGVVTNNTDNEAIATVAATVYELFFCKEKCTPHLLLRDYARGVMEYALMQECLPPTIPVESFRPPYSSDWPLENPTNTEIDLLCGDEQSSSIRDSLMGFPGDFGNYGMSSVHKWSPTPLSEEKPQTAHDLKMQFADQLNESLKSKYLTLLEKEEREGPYGEVVIKGIIEKKGLKIVITAGSEESSDNEKIDTIKILREEISASMTEDEKEYFRWVSGLGRGNSLGAFSRKWAQRWVCKRVYELGWTEERFGYFEQRGISHYSNKRPQIERIGKKYQRIAFHEFLAHLADNVHYIDHIDGGESLKKDHGPWEQDERDLDPTIWLRKKYDPDLGQFPPKLWWQPFNFPFAPKEKSQKIDWLWSNDNLPQFVDLLIVKQEHDNEHEWCVLSGFSEWIETGMETDPTSLRQKAWLSINSCIIRTNEWEKLQNRVTGKNLNEFSHTVNAPSTGHQIFYREYPWHPSCDGLKQWINPEDIDLNEIPVRNLASVIEYEWERNSTDLSLESSIRMYMPASRLIMDLGLSCDNGEFGVWRNKFGDEAFIDPSVLGGGPSYALVRRDLLALWLKKNGFSIVWMISGYKSLYPQKNHSTEYHGKKEFFGALISDGEKIEGNCWTIDTLPDRTKEIGPIQSIN